MKLYLIRGVLENAVGTEADTKGLAEKALAMMDEVERLAMIGECIDKAAKEKRPLKTVERYAGDKKPVKVFITEKDLMKFKERER